MALETQPSYHGFALANNLAGTSLLIVICFRHSHEMREHNELFSCGITATGEVKGLDVVIWPVVLGRAGRGEV